MGFAAVARVTPERWGCLAVNDEIAFGLQPGGELKVETTICHEVRQARDAVVIDHVAEDEVFCKHHTPATYGFQSYISMPIFLKDGRFFGTLCAIDPRPHRLKNPETIGMFKLFAELIVFHLDASERLAWSEASLLGERKTSELREQFIAVLGHDLRNPLASISGSIELGRGLERGERLEQRAIIGLEDLQPMLGRAIAKHEVARCRLDGRRVRLEQLGNPCPGAPQRRRPDAGRRRDVLADGLEELADEALGRPGDQADGAARPDDADQLVGGADDHQPRTDGPQVGEGRLRGGRGRGRGAGRGLGGLGENRGVGGQQQPEHQHGGLDEFHRTCVS